jgi:hypothetical protein
MEVGGEAYQAAVGDGPAELSNILELATTPCVGGVAVAATLSSRRDVGCRDLHDIASVIHQQDDVLSRL